MKNKSLLLAAVVASVLSASAFASEAKTPEVVNFEKPMPVKVGNVAIPQRHEGSVVTVRMTVDENGKPSNVRVVSKSDQTQYRHLIAAVKKWEFAPARKNGKAVRTRVELPIEVVENRG